MPKIQFSYFALLLLLIWKTSFTNAQILDVEKYKIQKDTANVFQGNISLGLTAKQQVNNVLIFNIKVNTMYLSDKHAYIYIANLNLLKDENSQLINDGYSHFRLVLFRQHRLSSESFLQSQYDLGRKLNERNLTGTCGRLIVFDNKKVDIAITMGTMYETEEWNATDSTKIQNNNIKSTNIIRCGFKIKKDIIFKVASYYQAKYDALDEPRISGEATMKFLFSKHISFIFEYSFMYDYAPVINIPNFTYIYTNKIAYDF